MLTLLSPAKSLDLTPFDGGVTPTEPRFPEQSEKLLKSLKRLKPKHIAELMDISKALSELNYERYQGFEDQTPGAANTPFALSVLTALFVAAPMSVLLLSSIIIRKFPIDEARQIAVREALAARETRV